ncbi:12619_t:CDS:2, partial [Dentiscutata erythropus]
MPKAKKSTLLNESDDCISFFIDQATVKNTKCSTSNWLKKFNDHCKEYTLDGSIETILNPKDLESNLIHFFSYAKRSDKEEYSQFSTLNTLLNKKFKWLSAKGKGETKGSESLTVDECFHILKHNCTSENTPWDGGYDIVIYKFKTNQCGINNPGQADRISIPNLEYINNVYNKYFSKQFNNINLHFYLQAIDENPKDEQTWYKDKHVGEKKLGAHLRYIVIASGIDISNCKITNQSGHQINPLLTKKAILTNTTTQVDNITPTFQTAKKILQ